MTLADLISLKGKNASMRKIAGSRRTSRAQLATSNRVKVPRSGTSLSGSSADPPLTRSVDTTFAPFQ